jgi:hypothetical protein
MAESMTHAEQRRAAALLAAATLIAPVLGDIAAAFRMEDMAATTGGTIKAAKIFEKYIAGDSAESTQTGCPTHSPEA